MKPEMRERMLEAIKAAQDARLKGNHPFGAVLAGPDGETLLTVENSVNTDHDPTAHAELNLVREAAQLYNPNFLARCTLFASTEPCPMCSGAIYWANIHNVVYGLSQESFYDLVGGGPENQMLLSCRAVFSSSGKPYEILGPIMEEEARSVHLGFWDD